jgi:predicted amidohydrolase
MKIYAVQHNILWQHKPANFERVSAMLAAANPAPGSLIVLEEMFATGFTMDVSATREPAGGETEAFLKGLALHYQCCVIGGLVGCASDGRGRNEALAIAPDGTELARYVKMKPFSMGDEHLVHEAGSQVMTFNFGGFRIAPLVCYDLRFPELAREAVKQGADLLIYIASWPIKRAHHWVTLLQARAIENLAWAVGVNRCGTDPDFTYPGRTLVVDPCGTIIADAADREGVLEARLDPALSAHWRAEFPALRDMR